MIPVKVELVIVNDGLRTNLKRNAGVGTAALGCPPSAARYAVLALGIATEKSTASESLSPTSAPRQKTSDTRRTDGSSPATCQQTTSCAASCRAHARGSAALRLRSVLPARYWDRSD